MDRDLKKKARKRLRKETYQTRDSEKRRITGKHVGRDLEKIPRKET